MVGRYGKTDNGVDQLHHGLGDESSITSGAWSAHPRARHFGEGRRTTRCSGRSWAIGAALAARARAAGFTFRAVAADSAYGDQDGFRAELAEAGLPFVMALKPRRGVWAHGPDAHTPVDAARALAWDGPGTIPVTGPR